MLTLIENGEIYAPEPLGRQSILLVDGKIGKIGEVDRRAVEALGLECAIIDARNCIVAPGLIDPHQHLLGGSGEKGFSTQTPEFGGGEHCRSCRCRTAEAWQERIPPLPHAGDGLGGEGQPGCTSN